MNRSFKRIFALLMACITVFGSCFTSASAAGKTTAMGDSLVSVTADASTSDGWSSVFTPGSTTRDSSSEGQVWVDKSVSADASDASFDITLSAMSEEYELSAEERSKLTSQQAADVLIVLDFSGSMEYQFGKNSDADKLEDTRAYAMTQAVNDVMYKIMTANNKNRVMITYFTDDTFATSSRRETTINDDGVLLPLGSYGVLQSDGTFTIPKEYFKLTESSGWYPTRYFEDNVTITNMSTKATVDVKQAIGGGTMSQYGIAYGCNRLVNQMEASTFDVQRTPFILFMTDGDANNAAEEWDEVVNSDDAADDNEIAALTILTAAYQKDQTIAAYNTRNNVSTNLYYEEITDIDWFNVGVSLSAVSGTPTWMQVMMDPTLTATSGSDVPAKVHNYIVSDASDRKKSEYASPDRYRYTDTGYVTYAQAADEVVKAFANLGEKVARLTGGTVIPITKKTTAAEEDDIFITFTDTIGDGMELVKNSGGAYDIKIKGVYDSDTHTVTTTEYTGQLKAGTDNVYEFVNGDTTLKSKATVNGSTIVWDINSTELPIIRFASRSNPGTAYDYDGDGTAEVYEEGVTAPITMTYTVKTTEAGVQGLSKSNLYLYSNSWSGSGNGTTTAVFTPSASNTFYKNRTAADVESKAKGTNATATAANVFTGAWNSGKTEYTVNLGNNGRTALMAKIELVADKDEVKAGDTVNYTIKITNVTEDKIEDAVVTADFDGATIQSSDPEQSGGKWTVDIPAGETTEIKVTVKADDVQTTKKYDETAEMTAGGNTIETTVNLTVTVGSTVTVNTKLNGSAASIESIVSEGTKLYLKGKDGTIYETTSTETGKYVVNDKLLDGEYEIVYGPDKDNLTATGEKVTVSGGDVTSDFNWYTVKFDNNSHGGTAPASQSVIAGKTAAEPTAPTDSDYTFHGWYTDDKCTTGEEYDFESAVNSETTLYAKWTKNRIDVTYPKYNPDKTPTDGPAKEDMTVVNGKTIKIDEGDHGTYSGTKEFPATDENGYEIDACVPDDGWVFLGYKVEYPEENVIKYTAQYGEDKLGGTDPADPKYPGDGVPDCYQKPVTYTVVNGTWGTDGPKSKTEYVSLYEQDGKGVKYWSVNGQGETNPPATTDAVPDASHSRDGEAWETEPPATVTGTDPVNYNYEFGTLNTYELKYRDEGKPDEAKKTESVEYGKKITIDPNEGVYTDGSGTHRDKFSFDMDEAYEVSDPTREDYTFDGWKRTEDGNGVTLTAQWKLTNIPVTYPEYNSDEMPTDGPAEKSTTVPNGWTIKIEEGTGKYKGIATEFTASDESGYTIDDCEPADGYVFMGYTYVVDKNNKTVTYTAQYGEDKLGGTDPADPKYPGDGVPDCYQKPVTYTVVNGTWGDKTTEPKNVKTEYVTLTKDGKWSKSGSGKLAGVPDTANAQASEGYANTGAWEGTAPKKNDVVSGTEAINYDYKFSTKLYYPTVTTKLNDALKDVTEITGDSSLYLGDGRVALDKQSTGSYKAHTALPAGDYIIYNSEEATAGQYGTLSVSDGGENTKELNWYTVEFDNNGHGTKPATQSVFAGNTAADQTMTETGYTFQGWYTDDTLQTKYDFSTPVTSAKTLYAKWTLDNIPVEYPKYNEGTEPTPETPMTVSNGATVRVDPNGNGTYNGSKDKYEFTATDENGYKIGDCAADKGWIFMGYEVSYPEKNVVLYTAMYLKDEVGGDNPGDPAYPGDGIPDDFEKKLTYTIENGTWDQAGEHDEDISEYVVLYDKTTGKMSKNGEGTPAKAPENTYPVKSYTQSSETWTPAIPTVVSGSNPEQFDCTYDTLNTYDLTYRKENKPDEPKETDSVSYGATVTVDPAGGKYTGDSGFKMTDEDGDKTSYEVPDPTRDHYIFNGWQKSTDKDGNVTLTAQWIERIPGTVPEFPGLDKDNDPNGPPQDKQLELDPGQGVYVVPHPDLGTEDPDYEAPYYVQITTAADYAGIVKPAETNKVFVGWTVEEVDMPGPEGRYEVVYKLTANYADDSIGDPNDPDGNGSDKVPDCFQMPFTYTVVNGVWDGKSTDPVSVRTEYVTLKDADGNWSKDGTGTLNVPDAALLAKPAEAYTSDGGWNSETPFPTEYKVDKNTAQNNFEYIFSTEKTYTVSFDTNGLMDPDPDGTAERKYPDLTKVYGNDLSLPQPERIGYTFNGWKIDGTETVIAPGEPYTGNSDAKLVADWTRNSYTLTYPETPSDPSDPSKDPADTPVDIPYGTTVIFDPNGGTFRGSSSKTTITMPAEAINAEPDPTREGYTFNGWVIEKKDNYVTFTAQWVQDKVIEYPGFVDENPKDDEPDREPKSVKTATPYKQYILIDPNGGTYNSTTAPTLMKVVADASVGTPTAPDGKVFVGWKAGAGGIYSETEYVYKLVAQYADDGKNGVEPNNVADIFEVVLTYKVVNGYWEGTDSADRTEAIKLYVYDLAASKSVLSASGSSVLNCSFDTEGILSADGTGTAHFPDESKMVAKNGYTKDNSSWSPAKPADLTKITKEYDGKVYTYSFSKIVKVTFPQYQEPTGSEPDPKMPEEKTTTTNNQRTITINPNGGEYEGKKTPFTNPLTEDITLGTPTAPENMVFVGWKEEEDEDHNLIYTAQYMTDKVGNESDPDNKGDGIPDCFQKRIEYRIENGYWSGTDDTSKVSYVTLKNEDGDYDVNGTASISLPTGMVAKEGFYLDDRGEAKSWTPNKTGDPIEVTGTESLTYTFKFYGVYVYYSVNNGDDPSSTYKKMDATKTLTIDPNGGYYRNSSSATVLSPVTNTQNVGDATAPSGYSFAGWYVTENDGNIVMTATYKKISTSAKTDDALNPVLWIGLSLAFAGGLAYFTVSGVRKRKNSKSAK